MAEFGFDKQEIFNAGEYGSEFEYDSEGERKRAKRKDLAEKEGPAKSKLPSTKEVAKEFCKEEGRTHRFHILSLDAYSRHRKLVNDYLIYFGGSKKDFKRDTSGDKVDFDIIRENHQFLWDDDEDATDTWEKRLAKKYYDKLFKEYCIADLSRYKENKVAMRWRIEKEVVDGKGQFKCGDKRCSEEENLRTWEVNFGYVEQGEKKNALVKLRLCPDCSYKLNYHHRKKEVRRKRKSEELEQKGKKKAKKSEPSESGQSRSPGSDMKKTDEKTVPNVTDEREAETEIWSGPAKVSEDKSREEEFDEYFEDLFL